MADKTQVEFQLIKNEEPVPAPDELIAGNKGAVYIDLVKISTAGTFKRGTLLMAAGDNYVASTQAGLAIQNTPKFPHISWVNLMMQE